MSIDRAAGSGARPGRRALVLAGGGAKGAYQFGCLRAFRERGIHFTTVALEPLEASGVDRRVIAVLAVVFMLTFGFGCMAVHARVSRRLSNTDA